MSENQKLKRWFDSFKRELSKYFDKDETAEIISYYEEMLNDKLDAGESLDRVLSSYDPKQIARSMIPKVVSDRTEKDKHKTRSNLWLMIIILFSTPLWIPLGIVFLVLVIVAFSLMFSGGAIIVSGILGSIGRIILLFGEGLAFSSIVLQTGMWLVVLAILSGLGYILVKWSYKALEYMVKFFGKLLSRDKE